MIEPLTAELLSKRTVVLHARCVAAGGEPGEIAFNVLGCDGCGLTVDLLADGHPADWTTSGDFARGFADHCPDCSP